MRLHISPHAIERFRERHGECDNKDERQVRVLLREELERGVPYGAQRGSNELQLLPCGLVAAVELSNGVMVVKTILTQWQAIANMQSQGINIRVRVLPSTMPRCGAPDRPAASQPDAA
jgi:hypothetical protein